MSGRFSHPKADQRFPTSAAALLSAQRFAERADGEIQLGVYENDETEGRRQILRVERIGDAVITTKIAEAIREEPDMASGTRTRKRKADQIIEDEANERLAQIPEGAFDAPPEDEVEATVAETATKEETKVSNGTIDREAVTKSVKGKMTRAGAKDRIPEDRYEAAVKYGVRLQLHKDGSRTKPTDYARQGLTKDDVVVLSEALGV